MCQAALRGARTTERRLGFIEGKSARRAGGAGAGPAAGVAVLVVAPDCLGSNRPGAGYPAILRPGCSGSISLSLIGTFFEVVCIWTAAPYLGWLQWLQWLQWKTWSLLLAELEPLPGRGWEAIRVSY